VIRAHGQVVAWIAFVVGVHFLGLGTLWRAAVFHVLGAVLTVLGLAGFGLHLAGASSASVALVSGIASGVALDLSVATWVYSATESGGFTR
jgi:hypothetical protein